MRDGLLTALPGRVTLAALEQGDLNPNCTMDPSQYCHQYALSPLLAIPQSILGG
jgi:hypothetical protein